LELGLGGYNVVVVVVVVVGGGGGVQPNEPWTIISMDISVRRIPVQCRIGFKAVRTTLTMYV
jgi:hypothetical protein